MCERSEIASRPSKLPFPHFASRVAEIGRTDWLVPRFDDNPRHFGRGEISGAYGRRGIQGPGQGAAIQ